jgi:hypothetical protein
MRKLAPTATSLAKKPIRDLDSTKITEQETQDEYSLFYWRFPKFVPAEERLELDDLLICYGYVYITTFTRPTDGKEFYYVGQHTGDRLDRRYIGSGLRIKRLEAKYGRKGNLHVKILVWAKSQQELDFKEILLICFARALFDSDCINLSYGGEGGGMSHSTRAKIGAANTGKKAYRRN